MLGSAFTKVIGVAFAYTLLLQDLLRDLSELGASPADLRPESRLADRVYPAPSTGARVIPISAALAGGRPR